jgi:hypothetical protein
MTDLHDLLDRVATYPTVGDSNVTADLRRGHRALSRRRTRWVAGASGALVAAGAVGYAALPRDESPSAVRPSGPGPANVSSAAPVEPRFFDGPQPPDGWHVVGDTRTYLMIGPDGTTSTVDSSFVGRVVVMLGDGNEHYGIGSTVTYDDRTFYVNDANDDATILAVRTRGGDWLQLQYPPSAFGVHRMVVYLDGVSALAGAEKAQG